MHGHVNDSPSPARRAAGRLFDVRDGEWPKALAMAAIFFLVIATFWVLKPLKRGLLIGYYGEAPLQLFGLSFAGAEAEQLGKVLNMFVAFVAVGAFTFAVRRVCRHHLVVTIAGMFAVVFLLFARVVEDPSASVVWSFYVTGDLFNTLLVALFWAFMSDIVHADQAKRLYGIVGFGGVLGGFVGSTIVRHAVADLGRVPLLYICVVPMVLVAAIVLFVNRYAEARGAQAAHPVRSEVGSHAVWEGARLVFRSHYLMGIAGVILLYELVSNIVDFQLAATVQESITGDTERDAFFALIGQISGAVSIFVQLILTSWIMRRHGVGVALLILPLSIAVGAAGYLAFASLAFAALMSTSDNALNYSINQSAKEALYVPTTRAEKYKAKAFIDMFLQRTAKVLAVGLNLGVATFVGLSHVRWLAIATLLALSFWVPIALYLGRRFEGGREATRPRPWSSGVGT